MRTATCRCRATRRIHQAHGHLPHNPKTGATVTTLRSVASSGSTGLCWSSRGLTRCFQRMIRCRDGCVGSLPVVRGNVIGLPGSYRYQCASDNSSREEGRTALH
jgi:hypothetical protein